ncbi:uncharacterized protein Ecym_8242 [Eremothecium cymbalariae DBVPG|uniref:Uncharacterized protein n=1 Tax=Eremothecium cymbalariae (strain CBS 270.75 / DBVPG 7215 / KCTC 17166 / NRRL Y-17582) TaxID=931890 RepID=G8JXF2_ERECY|nr:Hypothetical protein Ecym_8242 [Eremothecium cymbalariae DBVPG\
MSSWQGFGGLFCVDTTLPTIPEEEEPRVAEGSQASSLDMMSYAWADSPLTMVSVENVDDDGNSDNDEEGVYNIITRLVDMYDADIRNQELHLRFIREYVNILNSQIDTNILLSLRYLQSMMRPLQEVVNGVGRDRCGMVGGRGAVVSWGCDDENCPP